MKKIEKVKKNIYLEGESIGIREFYEVINKINELIEAFNQSQKQPEEEVPIMQVEDEYGSYWVADNHIEEYPEEPTNWEIILDLLKSWIKELVSKLTTK